MRACRPAGKTHRACVWHATVSRATYRLDATKLALLACGALVNQARRPHRVTRESVTTYVAALGCMLYHSKLARKGACVQQSAQSKKPVQPATKNCLAKGHGKLQASCVPSLAETQVHKPVQAPRVSSSHGKLPSCAPGAN